MDDTRLQRSSMANCTRDRDPAQGSTGTSRHMLIILGVHQCYLRDVATLATGGMGRHRMTGLRRSIQHEHDCM